jgi:hypothetical protein
MKVIKLTHPPPTPPGLPPAFASYMKQMEEWLARTAETINRASEENDRSTRYGYTITGTSSELRAINMDTATTTEVLRFVATFARDLKTRQILR